MAYNKRTWLGRQGTGLNKFSIGGASPVTIVNQPDSVTQVGDALSAGNLNDLEDRIEDAFDDVDTALDAKADEQDVTNLNNAITQIGHRVSNLEQAHGSYDVQNYKDGSITPSGKGNWAVVEGLRGVSRGENNAVKNGDFSDGTTNWQTSVATLTTSDGVATFTANAQNGQIENTNGVTLDNTHFYLYSLKVKGSSSNNGLNAIISGAGAGSVALNSMSVTTSWQTFMGVFKPQINSTTAKVIIYDGRSSGWDAYQIKDVFFTDLSVYFGTTDLSFLGATNAEKLATIQTNYPHLLLPSDYGVRIVDSSYSGVRAWAKNLCDTSAFENVNIGADGGVTPNPVCASSTDYIKVQAGSAMTFSAKTSVSGIRIAEYDIDKNFLKRSDSVQTTSITLQSNTQYVRWCVNYNGSTTVTKAILDSIEPQLEYGSSRTTFSEYREPSTLSLTFNGRSAGSVYDQLETNAEIVQEIDGQKVKIYKKRETQRIVSTALDNKTWIRRNDGLFYTSTPVFSDAKDSSSNVLCDKFLPCPSGQTGTSTPEGCISVGSGGYIYAMKAGIADTTAFLAYVADSVLYSEAKTESVTLSDPLIDNTLLTESGGRMATVQTGTVVDGSFDMGFITL